MRWVGPSTLIFLFAVGVGASEKPPPSKANPFRPTENPPKPFSLPAAPAMPAPVPHPPPAHPAASGSVPPPAKPFAPPRQIFAFLPPKYTTAVPKPINPKTMGSRGNAAQSYLGALDDARDLALTVENTEAQKSGAEAAVRAYEKIFANQEKAYGKGVLSADEYAQSYFDLESARAHLRLYKALVEMNHARLDQKTYQLKLVAKQIIFNVEDYYKLYTRDWDGQCEAANAFVQIAHAQRDLNEHFRTTTKSAWEKGAGPYVDYELREKDLAAAEADLKAKHDAAARCRNGLPTLEELKALMKKDQEEQKD